MLKDGAEDPKIWVQGWCKKGGRSGGAANWGGEGDAVGGRIGYWLARPRSGARRICA